MATTLAAFAAYAVVLALVPGPDNLFVLTQAATRGILAGLWITLGLCTGLLVHTAAVILGLAAVLAASPGAFTAIRIVGAAYLLYLAWGAFRSDSLATMAPGRARSSTQYYRQGIVMNVTNPKVAMFFLAFLPQFTDPATGNLKLQLLLLGAIFIASTLLVFSAIAVAAGRLREVLVSSPQSALLLNKAAGVIFVALAARLLLDQP
jgi:threonine/homoserine/homoserine lactone efflux protein